MTMRSNFSAIEKRQCSGSTLATCCQSSRAEQLAAGATGRIGHNIPAKRVEPTASELKHHLSKVSTLAGREEEYEGLHLQGAIRFDVVHMNYSSLKSLLQPRG